jgi:hypothetical protein
MADNSTTGGESEGMWSNPITTPPFAITVHQGAGFLHVLFLSVDDCLVDKSRTVDTTCRS